MVGERDHSKLVVLDVVDDAEGESAEWEAASAFPPKCAQLWASTEEIQDTFEFGDKGKAELGGPFLGIVDSPVGEASWSASALTEGIT